MKRILFIISLASCFLFTACHKKQQQPAYIPGRVIIGIKPGVPVESVFSFANNAGLYLLSVEYYDYTSTYPKDSFVSFSNNLLNTKPYINKITLDTTYDGTKWTVAGWASVKWDSAADVINVSCTLMNMDIASQADWINTKQQLGLTDKTIGDKMIYVKVPVGQEETVINKIQNNPIVEYADLNQIEHMLF